MRAFNVRSMRAITTLVAISFLAFSVQAQTKSDWFKSLMRPDTLTSCCDDADCKVDDTARFDDGQWTVEINGRRQAVQRSKILETESYDGRAYSCVYQGVLLCFVKPGGGY